MIVLVDLAKRNVETIGIFRPEKSGGRGEEDSQPNVKFVTPGSIITDFEAGFL